MTGAGNKSSASMQYEFCARTDPGKVRGNNEDAVHFDPPTGVAVLADGMGGYAAGEVASGMATAFIVSELSRWLREVERKAMPREIQRALRICVENANTSIVRAASTNRQYAGMGTTVVVGVFHGNRLVLGHVGDSRCYRLRAGVLMQITRDHSLLQEQLDAGYITAEQAAVSVNKNLVTRALGVDEAVDLEVNDFKVESGDLYMMCSDGLSDMMDDEAIARLLGAQQSLEQVAESLIDTANANGGRDNISVLLVKARVEGTRKGLLARWLSP